MLTIGIADTTFARYNMGRAAIDEIQKNVSVKIKRVTVDEDDTGPLACDRLVVGEVALQGDVAVLVVDRLRVEFRFAHGRRHENEGKDEKELAFLMDRRTREHALNVIKLLFKPDKLIQEAGTGQRQGFEDAGPLRM